MSVHVFFLDICTTHASLANTHESCKKRDIKPQHTWKKTQKYPDSLEKGWWIWLQTLKKCNVWPPEKNALVPATANMLKRYNRHGGTWRPRGRLAYTAHRKRWPKLGFLRLNSVYLNSFSGRSTSLGALIGKNTLKILTHTHTQHLDEITGGTEEEEDLCTNSVWKGFGHHLVLHG